MYANFNEYGTSNIPSRPFFRTALNNNRKYIKEQLKELLGKVATGKITGEVALKSIGLEVQGLIQDGNLKAVNHIEGVLILYGIYYLTYV